MRTRNGRRFLQGALVGLLIAICTSVWAGESKQRSSNDLDSRVVHENDKIRSTKTKGSPPSASQNKNISRNSRDVQQPKAEQRPGSAKAKGQDSPRKELKAEQRPGRSVEKSARKDKADEDARQRPGKPVNKGDFANQDQPRAWQGGGENANVDKKDGRAER